MKLSHTLALVGTLLAAGTTASFAQEATLGEKLATGQISQGAFNQLIQFTGLTPDQAKQETLTDVVKLRWQDS